MTKDETAMQETSSPTTKNDSVLKVAVIETIWRGHTPTFFRIVTEAFLNLGCIVTLICPEPEEIKDELIARGFSEKRILTQACSNFPGSSHSRYAKPTDQDKYFRAFSTPLHKLPRQDLLYFSLIDPLIANFWGLIIYLRKIHTTFSGLWMHPYITSQTARENRNLKNRLYETALSYTLKKYCIGLTTLDENAAPILSRKLGLPILRFPDCVEINQKSKATETSERLKKYASGRKIIGILGIQAAWKGIFLALGTVKLLPKDIVWAFVGPDEKNEEERKRFDATTSELNEKGYSIFKELRYIENEDYNNVIASCDIIWCVYPYQMNSSNTLTKAALHRKPVVAIQQGLIGERVSRFGLGISVPAEVDAIGSAISDILDKSFSPNYEGMERFIAEHDIANVKMVIESLLANTRHSPAR